MTPIGSVHAGKTNRLNRFFARAAADGLVSVQSPLRLDAYNEPEPDVMLLKPTEDNSRNRCTKHIISDARRTSLALARRLPRNP